MANKSSNVPIDAPFFEKCLPGRDQETVKEWIFELHAEEVRTVADARLLTEGDWDKISLPAVVRRAIITACKPATPEQKEEIKESEGKKKEEAKKVCAQEASKDEEYAKCAGCNGTDVQPRPS